MAPTWKLAYPEFVLPLAEVCCPFCDDWVEVDAWSMLESLWMHEYDCRAISKDYELMAA
jgi:hypothetical protein